MILGFLKFNNYRLMAQRKRNLTKHILRYSLLIINFALIVINTFHFLSIFAVIK
jgi:hypothetical protein